MSGGPSGAAGAGAGGVGAGAAVVQGIDTLTSALHSNIVPDHEYLLQGSVLDQHVDFLKHRLRGLCDNVDGGQEAFQEREMVFSLAGAASSAGTAGTGGPGQPLHLRVRRPLADGGDPAESPPWQLRYVGQPELERHRATTVRSCYDIACSENAVEFLTELGCRLDFEFVAKGYLFRKGRMKVTVSKIFKVVPSTGADGDALTASHLVEMSVLAPSGSDAVAEDMRNFSEQLKPLVVLDKIDPRRSV